jgi:guanyl-specific ribonuclease Sa
MAFPPKVRRDLLIKSGRRCCLCMEYRGTHIEVHHIVPEAEGGTNKQSNGIPLCFDCHADVPAYNLKHPRGTKFTAEELRQHRNRLFQHIEQGGPLVLDLITRESFTVSDSALFKNDPLAKVKRVDLTHDSRVARYRKFIRTAEGHMHKRQFQMAISHFESAFLLAESDDKLEDYTQGGNYHYRKIFLWQCYLEEIARSDNRNRLRAVVNMKMDENAIKEILVREQDPGGLTCTHYFYLLLQEKLFLFDEQIRHRKGRKFHLGRTVQFMDLIEDPHCPERKEELVSRAEKLRREINAQKCVSKTHSFQESKTKGAL